MKRRELVFRIVIAVIAILVFGLVYYYFFADNCNAKISNIYFDQPTFTFGDKVNVFMEFENQCSNKIGVELFEGANLIFSTNTSRDKIGYNWLAPHDGGYDLVVKIYDGNRLLDAKKTEARVLPIETTGGRWLVNPIDVKRIIVNSQYNYTNVMIYVSGSQGTIYSTNVDLKTGTNAIAFDRHLEPGFYDIKYDLNKFPLDGINFTLSGV